VGEGVGVLLGVGVEDGVTLGLVVKGIVKVADGTRVCVNVDVAVNVGVKVNVFVEVKVLVLG
jgi:hypothetical protein